MLPFKNENNHSLDNLSKYGHTKLKLSVGILSGLLQYFQKDRPILVQKLGEEKKLSKSVSGYFMTKKEKEKKESYSHEARGRGVRQEKMYIFPQQIYIS